MNCKICGGTTEKTEYYYECRDCGFFYKDLLLSPVEEKKRYDNHNNTIESPEYLTYLTKIRDSFGEFVKGDIIDYGCGEGKVLSLVFGYDYYDKYYHPGNITKLYDTVLLIETIEHFQEPIEEIRKIVNIMNDGGHLCIKTNFWQKQGLNWWYLRDETHCSFFTYESFKKVCKTLSLSIQYSDESSIIVLKKEA